MFDSSLEVGPSGAFATLGGASAASATTQDFFTLTGAPQTGFLRYVFSMSGTQHVLLVNEQVAGVNYVDTNLMVNNNSVGGTPFVNERGVVSLVATFDLPYSGNFIASTVVLTAITQCPGAQPLQFSLSHSCTASGDYSNTVTVVGLGVVDSRGIPVSGSSILAQSGFAYASLASTVPEPSTAMLFLLGTGLAALVTRRRFEQRK